MSSLTRHKLATTAATAMVTAAMDLAVTAADVADCVLLQHADTTVTLAGDWTPCLRALAMALCWVSVLTLHCLLWAWSGWTLALVAPSKTDLFRVLAAKDAQTLLWAVTVTGLTCSRHASISP